MGNNPMFALVGAHLIDGKGHAPLQNATVVVDNSNIVAAGPADHVSLTTDMPKVQLEGKTLMPGLIDGHVHLLSYAGSGKQDIHLWNVLTFQEEQTLHAAANARKALEAGVTTVRDMAGSRPEISVKHAIDDGVMPGARVVVCGMVGMTAGHADMFCPVNIEKRLWRPADGGDECRKRVREYARDGADWIKICTSGGVLSVGDKSEWRNYTLRETEIIVDEAHGLGMRVAAHAHTPAGIRQALLAGVDTVEHGTQLDDELTELMLDKGAWLCPTLAISAFIQEEGKARGVPEESLGKMRRLSEGQYEAIGKAFRVGIPIFMGTDSCNTMPFGRPHARELSLMHEHLDMSPMQAIVAATSKAAEALGIGDVVGTIEPGKAADLLVVDQDPLRDLTILQDPSRILAVYRDGRLMIDRGMNEFANHTSV